MPECNWAAGAWGVPETRQVGRAGAIAGVPSKEARAVEEDFKAHVCDMAASPCTMRTMRPPGCWGWRWCGGMTHSHRLGGDEVDLGSHVREA